jgi:hypothetical protein
MIPPLVTSQTMTDPSQEPETRHLLSDEKARHDNPAVCLVKVCETPVCGSHIRIVSSQDADAIDIFDSLTQPLESKVNISIPLACICPTSLKDMANGREDERSHRTRIWLRSRMEAESGRICRLQHLHAVK